MIKQLIIASIAAGSIASATASDRFYSYAYGPAENGYINSAASSANNPEFYRSDNYAERRQNAFDTRRHAAPGSRGHLDQQTAEGTPLFDWEHAGQGPCISEWSCD